ARHDALPIFGGSGGVTGRGRHDQGGHGGERDGTADTDEHVAEHDLPHGVVVEHPPQIGQAHHRAAAQQHGFSTPTVEHTGGDGGEDEHHQAARHHRQSGHGHGQGQPVPGFGGDLEVLGGTLTIQVNPVSRVCQVIVG